MKPRHPGSSQVAHWSHALLDETHLQVVELLATMAAFLEERGRDAAARSTCACGQDSGTARWG